MAGARSPRSGLCCAGGDVTFVFRRRHCSADSAGGDSHTGFSGHHQRSAFAGRGASNGGDGYTGDERIVAARRRFIDGSVAGGGCGGSDRNIGACAHCDSVAYGGSDANSDVSAYGHAHADCDAGSHVDPDPGTHRDAVIIAGTAASGRKTIHVGIDQHGEKPRGTGFGRPG